MDLFPYDYLEYIFKIYFLENFYTWTMASKRPYAPFMGFSKVSLEEFI